MHMKLIKWLLEVKAPRIVKRDLRGCYELESVIPVDMFPQCAYWSCADFQFCSTKATRRDCRVLKWDILLYCGARIAQRGMLLMMRVRFCRMNSSVNLSQAEEGFPKKKQKRHPKLIDRLRLGAWSNPCALQKRLGKSLTVMVDHTINL